jgi:hypothetical protein
MLEPCSRSAVQAPCSHRPSLPLGRPKPGGWSPSFRTPRLPARGGPSCRIFAFLLRGRVPGKDGMCGRKAAETGANIDLGPRAPVAPSSALGRRCGRREAPLGQGPSIGRGGTPSNRNSSPKTAPGTPVKLKTISPPSPAADGFAVRGYSVSGFCLRKRRRSEQVRTSESEASFVGMDDREERRGGRLSSDGRPYFVLDASMPAAPH